MSPAAIPVRPAAAVLLASLVQVGPGVTWLPPVRLRCTPRLSGLGRKGHLALTFDDGPHPQGTPAVLDALDRLGWHATFFLLGSKVRAEPGIAAQIAAAGHEIGVHGDEHRYLLTRMPGAASADLGRAIETIRSVVGHRPSWYRPPYGVLTTGGVLAAHRLRVRTVLWSAWGRDWQAGATPASILATISRGVLSGGTVLLHDSDALSTPGSWRATVGTLPLLAEEARRQRLTVGPLGEHGLGPRSC